jgi:hypothetical protein
MAIFSYQFYLAKLALADVTPTFSIRSIVSHYALEALRYNSDIDSKARSILVTRECILRSIARYIGSKGKFYQGSWDHNVWLTLHAPEHQGTQSGPSGLGVRKNWGANH